MLREPRVGADVAGSLLAGVRERGPDDEGGLVALRAGGMLRASATERSASRVRDRLPPLGEAAGMPHDVALLHARYAIVDLSDAAHQPFVGADGDVAAVLNGEIYNHVELRAALAAEGVRPRTSSDTEVLVEGYRLWGMDLWARMNGFWAVVIYDARDGSVVVSRDRMGVAPLYFRETEHGLFFASRIRPLLEIEPRDLRVDDEAVRGFVEAGIKDDRPATCWAAVKSFPPATTFVLPRGCASVAAARPTTFWRLPDRRLRRGEISLAEAARGMRERLVRAVELRLRADVRVAFELSGGLDSSSVVAAAAELGVRPRVYTVHVPARDEVPWARAVAERFGLEQVVLGAEGERFLEDAPAFAAVMEEPYHSPNVYASYRMRRAIKDHGESVVVSGTGGDEVLGGYEVEFWDAARRELWAAGRRWHALRHAIGHHAGSRERLRQSVRDVVGATSRRVRAAAGMSAHAGAADGSAAAALLRTFGAASFHERVRFHFEVAQLPYYLRNGDHLTMSIPLEHRFPFLDWELVEFGTSLPIEHLYGGGWSKLVLRESMRGLLPDEVVWRRDKFGFPFPHVAFLRANEATLRPRAERAVRAGYAPAPLDYRALVHRDPLRLWRLCSTGYWLDLN